MHQFMHPFVPLTALGAGMWLGAEPTRIDTVRAQAAAAARALRLATTCIAVAREYKAARSWSTELPASLVELEREHLRLQIAAGRAEHERAELVAQVTSPPVAALAAATDLARSTREVAVRAGEEYAARRVAHEAAVGSAELWDALHARCAAQLLHLCLANGGVYVKLGQHVAQLDYLVPEAYTRTLGALFQSNRQSTLAQVTAVIEEDLGQPLAHLFSSFEPSPIASASLAQVHRATERTTGRHLAVKVQHPGLRDAAAADLAAVALAVRFASYLFRDEFRLGWVLDELAPHLPLELDFGHERSNLERCARFFGAGGGDGLASSVAVPAVLPHLSSTRVLTMSYEAGTSIIDVEGIKAMGLRVADVSHLLCRTFNAQIFDGGFVHCDPHPGNVLVRPRPDRPTQPQLVLLDHGLYRELPREFVNMYADLWYHVLAGDADGIRRVSHALGVGDYYPLFAAMLTAKPWADILHATSGTARLTEKGTAEDKAAIRGYAQQYAKGIAVVLERVPAPMLLLFKTNDCLRHAERRLLGSGAGVDTMLVTMRFCLQTMLRRDSSAGRGVPSAATPPAGASGSAAAHQDLQQHARPRQSRLRRLQLALAVWLLRVASRGGAAWLERVLRVLTAPRASPVSAT